MEIQTKKAGQAVIYFDNEGFIDNVEISVSKISNEENLI